MSQEYESDHESSFEIIDPEDFSIETATSDVPKVSIDFKKVLIEFVGF